MLHEKYLPQFDFNEKHSLLIHHPAEQIFPIVDELDFSESMIIKLLFTLRGIPSSMMNKKGFSQQKFLELEKINNREIIIGLIGQFYKPSGNLQSFEPAQFTSFNTTCFLKSTWNFELIPQTAESTLLETETRIQCLGEKARKKFSRYWFFVQPFSGLIRMEILRSVRRKTIAVNGLQTAGR